MDYETAWNEIKALAGDVDLDTRRQIWGNRRGVSSAVEQRARAHYDRLINGDEALRRLSRVRAPEAQRVLDQLISEELQRATLAAGANRRRLQVKAAKLEQRLSELVEARGRDVSLSFPSDTLSGFDAPAMVNLAILREQLRPRIESMSVGELEALLIGARSRGAVGLVEFELAEDRIRRGNLSKQPADLPIVKRLNERVEFEAAERLTGLGEDLVRVQEVLVAAARAISFADVAGVRPIDAEQPANAEAKAADRAEGAIFEAEQAANA